MDVAGVQRRRPGHLIWCVAGYSKSTRGSLADSSAVVGEDEEVSIKEVADAIVKAVGYEGDYKVRFCSST